MCVFVCVYTRVCLCVGDTAEATSAGPTTSTLPKLHWAQPQEVPLWDISNCVLEDGQILISPEEEVSTHSKITQNHNLKASSYHFCVFCSHQCGPGTVLAVAFQTSACRTLLISTQVWIAKRSNVRVNLSSPMSFLLNK